LHRRPPSRPATGGRAAGSACAGTRARRVATQVTLSAEESTKRASARPRPGTGTRTGGPRASGVRAGHRRAAEHPARAAPPGAARGRGHPRIRHRRRRAGGRRGAQPLAGRRARGGDLLPRPAPHSPGRAPGRPVPG
jgi:hypothetical protein